MSHAFGRKQALSEVSLSVPVGVFAALLGVNGAGKSTLFNLVTRLFNARSGRIAVCGHDVRAAPREALRRMGVVFQSRALDPSLTVAQNAVYHGALHGLPPRESLARAETALARMRLADRMGERVGRLSGGQARRVEIAQAMLHRPQLLLCDEATVGLDVQSRVELVADVHALAADEGAGVLWATHLIDEVSPLDLVYVLHEGRVLASGGAAGIGGAQGLTAAFLAMTGASARAVSDGGA